MEVLDALYIVLGIVKKYSNVRLYQNLFKVKHKLTKKCVSFWSLHDTVMYSKLLRKPDTLKTACDIDKEEWKEINEELKVTLV